MAIALVGSVVTANNNPSSTTSLTASFTVSSGTDLMLTVGVSGWSPAAVDTVTGVTYGGVALTRRAQVKNNGDDFADIWCLVNPTVGTANVVVTCSSGTQIVAGISCWSGVHQTTAPTSATATGDSTATAPSLTISSATGDLVLDTVAFYSSSSGAMSVGAGQTSRWNVDNGSANDSGCGSTEAGAASVTMSWSRGNTNNAFWSIVAVNLPQSTGVSGISGTSAVTLGAATLTGAGALVVKGTTNATLGAATVVSAGKLAIAGSSAVTLGAASLASAGTVGIAGTAAVTLGAATLSATGNSGVSGSLSGTLGAATVTSTGTLAISGSAAVSLGSATLTAAGTLPISGTANVTLGAATIAATGISVTGGSGSASVTLGAATLSSAGTLAIGGAANVTLGSVTATGAGTLGLSGSASITLGAASLSAFGHYGDTAVYVPSPSRIIGTGHASRIVAVAGQWRVVPVQRRSRVVDVK
jgi:hypothetical protein